MNRKREAFDYDKWSDNDNMWIETKTGCRVAIIDSYVATADKGKCMVAKVYDCESNPTLATIVIYTLDGIPVENGMQDYILELVSFENEKFDYESINKDSVKEAEETDNMFLERYKYGGTFQLSKVEYLRYRHFCKKHHACSEQSGAIGGNISVNFTSSSIGRMPSVKCSICGEEVNITDYENI